MADALRIVLFTVDDLEFVPDLLEPVINEWGHSLVKAFVSRSLFDRKYLQNHAPTLLREGYPFCIRTADLARYAAMKLWSGQARRRAARNMVDFLRTKKVDAEFVGIIETEQFLDKLKSLNADIFLFGVFDKIARPKLLAIPRIGTFNVHMGKLPEHRGGFSSFWVLRFGDNEAGVTVHRAIEKVDAGEIISETRFPVTTRSMFELMHETFMIGGATINDALRKVSRGDWEPIPTAGRLIGYNRIPKRLDFREFYNRGCKLI